MRGVGESDSELRRARQTEKENNRYALATAGVFAHGEQVIGLKLNLTMDGG